MTGTAVAPRQTVKATANVQGEITALPVEPPVLDEARNRITTGTPGPVPAEHADPQPAGPRPVELQPSRREPVLEPS